MTFNLTKVSNMPSEGTDTNLDYTYTIEPYKETIINILDDEPYSKVGFRLTLNRHPVKQLLSYYFPSLIFVMVSWISFIIPPEVVPGRMTLLLTILLVLTTMFGTIMYHQPPCKYPSTLDIWIIACIVFVTGALFAYAAILLNPRETKAKSTKVKPCSHHDGKHNNEVTTQNRDWDRCCLKLFPASFVLFNVIYWPIVITRYLTQIEHNVL